MKANRIIKTMAPATRRAGAVTPALVASMVMAASSALAAPPGPEARITASVEFLSEGGGGSGSQATAGTATADGLSEVIVGRVRVAGGNGGAWKPAFWINAGDGFEDPVLLPDLGHGGRVNAVTTITDGSSNTLMLAGTLSDDAGVVWPYFGQVRGLGSGRELIESRLLPTPQGFGGEATGIVAIGPDVHGLIIVVCGRLIDSDGASQAAYWVCGADLPTDEFSLNLLPAPFPGGDSGATHVSAVELENTLISSFAGYGVGQNGEDVACLWTVDLSDSASQRTTLPSLPNAIASRSTAFCFADGSVRMVGRSQNADGRSRPTLWTIDESGDASAQALPLGGLQGGRANSIIAILIGLLVPGQVSGTQGGAAALWVAPTGGGVTLLNLNRLAGDLPPGARLTEALFMLPYIEQDNVYRVGASASIGGVPHAAIVYVHSGG